MAKNLGRRTWKLARHAALATAVLGMMFLSIRGVIAQDEPIGPGRAREALRLGIDHHKRGDYETAAGYFNFAQQAQPNLSVSEQQDLATFRAQNATAIKGRQDGAVQLKQATEAFQQGKLPEAGVLLKALDTNQYLSTADRQQITELNVKLSTAAPGSAPADAKSLLSAGRTALQKGEFDLAEAMAAKAEKAGSSMTSWLPQPWSDSPAKLRRDIQTAKAKTPAAPTQTAKAEPENKESSSWLPSMKNWFGKGEKQPSSADGAGKNEPVNAKAASERRIDNQIARDTVRDGFIFLQANDLEKAKFMANKAKELNATFGPGEQTPDQLLIEVQRRTPGAAPPVVAETKTAETKPIEMPNSTDPRVLLRHARMLHEKKRYDEADKLCGQILTMNARWGLWEDSPDKLRREVQRARLANDREDSFKVMADARKLFAQGNLEEAERKAYKAQQMHGPYGVFDFGDRPGKLIDEIQRTKQAKGITSPTEKSNPTQVAKDTPANIEKIGVDFNTNPPTFNKGGLPPLGVPAGIQNANKNRAIVMVREARDLERQGLLIEARQKAFEARTLKVTFTPDEDSPESVLLSLSAKCERQVQTMLQQAAEQIASAGDPQRFDKASSQLGAARALAQAFELDLSRVDQTALYVQQVYTGARPLTPVSLNSANSLDPLRVTTNFETPTGDPEKDRLRKLAREKLRDAQTELSHGKYSQARKMAEELYDAKYGLQDEVRSLLRSIGNEEYNQKCLSTKRNFDAGRDAYVQKEYRKAMFIFQSIDPLMLPEQYQARLRDIMATREMQPDTLVQAGYREKLVGSPLTVLEPGNAPKNDADDILKETKAREMVQFQALRQRGLEAQRTAHELFKNKQREQALNTLENFLEQIKLAQFDQNKADQLRRPVENKIQQYNAIIAQDKLIAVESGMRTTSYHDEGKRQTDIRKHQAEVLAMMNEIRDLMKANKLEEAQVKIKQVREIDPDNVAALAAEMITETRINQAKWNKGEKDNEKFFLSALPHSLGQPLDQDNPITFDKTRIDSHPKGGSGKIQTNLLNPKEQRIDYRLMQPLSLHFKDVPLQQAIKDIAIQSGIQVVPDLAALQQARVNLDAPLSVSVEDISMKSALNILLKPLRLTYIIEDEVLKITTEGNTVGRVVRVVYPVADLVAVPEDHPLPDVFNIQKMIERVISPGSNLPSYMPTPQYLNNPGTPVSSHSSGLGSAFGTTPGQPGQSPGTMPMPSTQKKDEMGLVLVQLIKNVIAKDKWADVGGQGDIHYTPFGLALVVNQVLDVQKDIEELLASLRRLQDLQVSVELRAVLVSESFFERIGVDFNMNFLTPGGPGKSALAAGNLATASSNKTITGISQAGTVTPDLNIPVLNNTFNLTTPQFGGYQPGAGLSLGLAFLSEIQVFMFLEAVSGDQRAHVMQAPKLTVYNGQTAFITANVSRPFVSGVAPITAPNGNTVMIPQITVYPLGLGMQVQPVVSPDRRFVRLNVTPILTSGFVDPAGQINIPTPAFPQNFPPVLTTGNPSPLLPTSPLTVTNGLQFNPLVANVNVVNTTVNVPDGGTVLMGGFKFLAEQRSEYGPPVLSQIPYLSRLFRNVGWSRDSSTLLYLVTARIIMVEEEEQIYLGNQPPIPRN